nr:MAG TPA: hypothetical protein [Bacteriophage sp.]
MEYYFLDLSQSSMLDIKLMVFFSNVQKRNL